MWTPSRAEAYSTSVGDGDRLRPRPAGICPRLLLGSWGPRLSRTEILGRAAPEGVYSCAALSRVSGRRVPPAGSRPRRSPGGRSQQKRGAVRRAGAVVREPDRLGLGPGACCPRPPQRSVPGCWALGGPRPGSPLAIAPACRASSRSSGATVGRPGPWGTLGALPPPGRPGLGLLGRSRLDYAAARLLSTVWNRRPQPPEKNSRHRAGGREQGGGCFPRAWSVAHGRRRLEPPPARTDGAVERAHL